jgi:signal transduction histidine kinase
LSRVFLTFRRKPESIAQLAKKVSSSIHSLSHQLHPSLLDLVGRVPSVEGLCREVSGKRNLQVQFVNHGIPEQILKDVVLCLFRITQEALRNIVEHSGAAAKVELSVPVDQIELCVPTPVRDSTLSRRKELLVLV